MGVKLSSITAEEFSVLTDMLNVIMPHLEYTGYSFRSAKDWLHDFEELTPKVGLENILKKSLTDMPLYINDSAISLRIVALWRLKIAR
jgi:hypothetical protein